MWMFQSEIRDAAGPLLPTSLPGPLLPTSLPGPLLPTSPSEETSQHSPEPGAARRAGRVRKV